MSSAFVKALATLSVCTVIRTVYCTLSTNQVRELSNRLAAEVILLRIPGKCKTDEYDCGEKCIPIVKWRDCSFDCKDRSDEECWPGWIKCPGSCTCVEKQDELALCTEKANPNNKLCSISGTYRCANGNCVLPSWINDSKNDCGDWSDEKNFTIAKTRK